MYINVICCFLSLYSNYSIKNMNIYKLLIYIYDVTSFSVIQDVTLEFLVKRSWNQLSIVGNKSINLNCLF